MFVSFQVDSHSMSHCTQPGPDQTQSRTGTDWSVPWVMGLAYYALRCPSLLVVGHLVDSPAEKATQNVPVARLRLAVANQPDLGTGR